MRTPKRARLPGRYGFNENIMILDSGYILAHIGEPTRIEIDNLIRAFSCNSHIKRCQDNGKFMCAPQLYQLPIKFGILTFQQFR